MNATELREDVTCDIAVVGSGGGALVAACRAADLGLDVVVLERSSTLGGTTAVSGGVLWAPNHHLMAELPAEDSAEEGALYLRGASRGTMPEDRIQWFVEVAPRAVRYLTDQTRVKLKAVARPDYHSDLPGAKAGRCLDNEPLDVRSHEGLEERLRLPTYFPPMTIIERDRWQGGKPDAELLAKRAEQGVRTLGGALIGRLILSTDDREIPLHRNVRARSLIETDGRVEGLEVDTPSGRRHVRTRRGVVLASGGFEWSEELQRAFLAAPVTPTSPPFNEGDGLKMALRVGALVENMSQVWGVPVIQDPAHIYEDRPSGRVGNVELTLPGAIAVNQRGRRFVNEALNYHDLSKVFSEQDVDHGGLRNQPAWMIFDARHRRRYPLVGHPPEESAPDWVLTALTPRELAALCEVDAQGLEDTIQEFNEHAAHGRDPQFHRGESAQDRHLGDQTQEPNPCLAPIDEPPYYAVPVRSGTLGTAGGLVTDNQGRVLGDGREPIAGLYAAGNVTANVYGDTYPGAGATISASVMRGFAIGDAVSA